MSAARDLPRPRPLPEMPEVIVVHYRNRAANIQFDIEIAATERNLERAKALGVDLLLLHDCTVRSKRRAAS